MTSTSGTGQSLRQTIRFLRGFLVLALLLASPRYRRRMREAADLLSEANDVVTASLRRLDAIKNEGKPKLRVLTGKKVP